MTPAQSIGEAIYSAILNVSGVTTCKVWINNDLLYNAAGIPPKTLCAVVVGGDDSDIAQILFTRLGGGVLTYGTTEVDYTDSQGIVTPIFFSRPIPVPVYLRISLTITDSSLVPSDVETAVKDNIVLYAHPAIPPPKLAVFLYTIPSTGGVGITVTAAEAYTKSPITSS